MAKTKERPPLESLHFKSPIQKDDLAEDAHKKFFEAMRGPKGRDGADGKTPVPGVDFPIPKDGKNGFDGMDGTNGVDGKDGKKGERGERGERGFTGEKGDPGRDGVDGRDGKSGSPDKPEDIIAKIHKAKTKIKLGAIDGLEDKLTSHEKTMASNAKAHIQMGGPSQLLIKQGGVEKGRAPTLNFTGATVTTSGQGNNAVMNIAMAGGTSVVGELVSGSGTTYTLANTPTAGTVAVYARGQRYFNFTISGAVITTGDTWAAGDIYADYSY